MAKSDVTSIQDIINNEIDNLIGLLNMRRDDLLRELYIIKKNEGAIIYQIEKLKKKTDKISRHTELSNTYIYITSQLDQKLEEKKLENLKKKMKFEFQSQTDEIEKLISDWGKIFNEEFIYVYEDGKDGSADDKLKQLETTDEFGDCLARSKMVIGNEKAWRENIDSYIQYGMAIEKKTNFVYVAEANNSVGRISVFSEEGDFLRSDNLGNTMKSPYGIAIHGDNIYLTDHKDHSVTHFRIKCDQIVFTIKYGSRGARKDQFRYPGQLDISPEGDLYIPDLSNRRIQILGETLNYKGTFKHHDMTHPRDVKVRQNQIYILNSTPSCILLFSREGELITSFQAKKSLITLISPNFFCFDSQNNFIVADSKSNIIKVFLMYESKIQTLMATREENLKLTSIGGILYTNDTVITSTLDAHFKPRMTTYQLKLLPKISEKQYNFEDLKLSDGAEALISESRNMLNFMKKYNQPDLQSPATTPLLEPLNTSHMMQNISENILCPNENLQNPPENSQN